MGYSPRRPSTRGRHYEGQDLDWDAHVALEDGRLSSEITIRSTSGGIQPGRHSMTMEEIREIDKKNREAFLEEWAPILEVMNS